MDTKSKLAQIKQREPAFELINLNGRPVFVRILDDNSFGCDFCSKRALFKVFEIDKFVHYSSWQWCGSEKCEAD